MSWTPTIVGGTDHGDEPAPDEPEALPQDVVTTDQEVRPPDMIGISGAANSSGPPSNDVEYVTAAELSVYAMNIAAGTKVAWDYGPEEQMQDGGRISKGQYVEEYRNDVLYKTFWVSL